MRQKIRTALGYAGLSLILTVNTFSLNLLAVNAEETVQDSSAIQEESLQTDFPSAEESEPESSEPEQDDANTAEQYQADAADIEQDQAEVTDAEPNQADDQTLDNTAVETVNEETKEDSSDQKEITPELQTGEESITDTVIMDDDQVDYDEPVNAASGGIFLGAHSVSYDTDILADDNNRVTLNMLADEDVLSVESSDEKVAVIDGWNLAAVYLNLKAPGTTQIIVTGTEGGKDTCTVTVEDPGLVIEDKELTGYITDGDIGMSVAKGYGLTYTSSDPSVVQAYKDIERDPTGKYCRLELQKPGKADIIVGDFAGRTETVHVTVKYTHWSLSRNKIDDFWIKSADTLLIYCDDNSHTFTVKSSDSEIVSISYSAPGWIGCIANNLGTAVITVTDQYGIQQTCTITVKPTPISFGENKTVKYNTFHGYIIETFEYYLYTSGDNIIKSVTSSNTNVVTAKRTGNYYVEVSPVGAGTAVITATDQYNQKATIQVTVTQKYADEKRFHRDLFESSYAADPKYGETQILCHCPIDANIYTIINGKKYTGVLQIDGYYHIKGLPRLPAGTKLKVGFQKGQAVALQEVTVQKVYAPDLPVTVKAQTYTGKAVCPAVTIKHGKTILKKGTDYTVKYTNNKNVGNGKVTIAFKGNYFGSKAVIFKINPPKTSLTKTAIRKKDFTVYWKKQAKQTTGYQIQYSTNSQFKKGNKAVTVSKTGTTSRKITGLKRKTTYYVRIRTYKKIGKTTFYSGWSAAKKVKTK